MKAPKEITKEFYENLPKKRMAAGAILRDNQERILMLQPGYKSVLEIPGGIVEAEESPYEACKREIKEELGLDITLRKMLCIDYNKSTAKKTESLMFIFDGGKLEEDTIEKITIDGEEILNYKFMTLEEMKGKTAETLYRRIEKSILGIQNNRPYYLENQELI